MDRRPYKSAEGYDGNTPVNMNVPLAEVETKKLDQLEKLSKEGFEPAKKYLEAYKKFESILHLVRHSSASSLKRNHALQSRILLDLVSVLRIDPMIPSWSRSEMTILSTVTSIADFAQRQDSSSPSELDKALRICQLYFASLLDPHVTVKLASEFIEIYPTEPYFHFMHGSMLGLLGKIEEGIQVSTKALEVLPNNLNLLYNKATFLKHAGGRSIEERIEACQAFLKQASKIDRHVSLIHYEIGIITATEIIPEAKSCKVFTRALNMMKKAIENGEDAEKYILPHNDNLEDLKFYGPPVSFTKYAIVKAQSLISTIKNEDQKTREIILKHRSRLYFPDMSNFEEIAVKLSKIHISDTNSEIASSTSRKLTKYTLIEPAAIITSKSGSNINLYLVLQQTYYGEITECEIFNFDITRFDKELQKRGIQKLFGIGCKISITNSSTNEGRILVYNPCQVSLIFHVEECLDRPCYYCGIEDASMQCVKCKVATYCDRHCQKRDWKVFDHRTICSKMVNNVA